jgi:adhesin transport system outer membrane protein
MGRLADGPERTNYLINQAQISGNFLDLARKERELGRRSLLDLLNGEVALINAQSDAAAARWTR